MPKDEGRKTQPRITDREMLEQEREREILEELRRAVSEIRGRAASRKVLFPADKSVTDLLTRTAPGKQGESSTAEHSFNAYVLKTIDDVSLLEERYSLARLREELDHCQAVLQHFRAGQSRSGVRARLANYVALMSRRVLKWFIAPSMIFDESAMRALSEITAAIETMQRQLKVIADELAALRKASEGREEIHNSGK